jgi:hypothetical protein
VIFPGSKIGARPHILTAIGSAKLAYQDAFNYPALLFAWWIFYNYTVVHGGGERLEG